MDFKNFTNFKNSRTGFTLVELLVYSVLFVVAGGLVTGITLNIKKNADIEGAQKLLDTSYADLSNRLRAVIESSTAVSSITDNSLSLVRADSASEYTFSLVNNHVFYKQGDADASDITGPDVSVDAINFKLSPPQFVGIDPVNHWAYNDIVGWIDFGETNSNIKIPTGRGDLMGTAWGKASGYVYLNCLSADTCNTSSYKVTNDGSGNLSGSAWSSTLGSISFCGNSGGTNGCAVSSEPYGVVIDSNTGIFSGRALSQTDGYISFNCATGTNGNNVCALSNYRLQDLRRKTSAITVNLKIHYAKEPYQNISRSGTLAFNLKPPSQVKVNSISPSTSSSVVNNVSISGSYFKPGAVVKLTQSGSKDVYPTTNFSYSNTSTLNSGGFDFTNVPAGVWNVMVINPDGQVGVLANGFTVPTTTTTTTTIAP